MFISNITSCFPQKPGCHSIVVSMFLEFLKEEKSLLISKIVKISQWINNSIAARQLMFSNNRVF